MPNQSKRTRLMRSRIRETMEPFTGGVDSTWLSLFVDLFILFCILASCLLVPLEFIFPARSEFFFQWEIGFVTIFIVEYILRWYSSNNRLKFPFELYSLIDLAAILPTILTFSGEFIVPIWDEFILLRLLRGFRLFRLLRLIEFFRYRFVLYRSFNLFCTWFSSLNYQYRLKQLWNLLKWVMIAWVIGANLLYLTESMNGVREGPYGGYWKSYWHIIIVLISGIEDKEPVSLLGRIEVTFLLIAGIIVVGMLTAEIVSILVKRMQRSGLVAIKPPNAQLRNHILILGQNSHLDNILSQLYAALKGNYYFLLVSLKAEETKVTDPVVFKRVLARSGDPVQSKILDETDLEQALRIVILSADEKVPFRSIDNQTLMITLAVSARCKDVPMVVELQTRESLTYAKELFGIDFVVSGHYVECLASQAVLNPGVTDIYYELMNFTEQDSEIYSIPIPESLIGKTFQEAQLYYLDYDQQAIVLIGIDRSPSGIPISQFWINPASPKSGLNKEDLILKEEDNLIVMAYERPAQPELEKEYIWSGKVIYRS